MIRAPQDLDDLKKTYPSSRELMDGGQRYIHIPDLRFYSGDTLVETEGLLHLTGSGDYRARLYLKMPVPGKENIFSPHCLLGEEWHTFSYSRVNADLPPGEILANYISGLQ